MTDTSGKADLQGSRDYRPWPELRHAAFVLRMVASTHEPGNAYTIMAELVMTAFSVEAFIQTLGPQVFGDAWTTAPAGKRPIERRSVTDKLKELGKKLDHPVNYGESPWKDIKALLGARDDMAHAKPATQVVSEIIEVPTGGQLPFDPIGPAIAKTYRPLYSVEELERLATLIDAAFLPLWTKAGNHPAAFRRHGISTYSITVKP